MTTTTEYVNAVRSAYALLASSRYHTEQEARGGAPRVPRKGARMRDRWVYSIVATLTAGFVGLIGIVCVYAEASHMQDTYRAKARIAVCKTLPQSMIENCLEHAG